MVSKAVNKNKTTDILNNNCAKCMRQFSGQSRPTQCIYCNKYYHKSSCLPPHSSLCQQRSSSPTDLPASSTLVRPGTSEYPIVRPELKENPLQRPRLTSTSASSTMIASTPSNTRVSLSTSTTLNIAAGQSLSNQLDQVRVQPPQQGAEGSAQTQQCYQQLHPQEPLPGPSLTHNLPDVQDPNPSLGTSSLNANAPVFNFSAVNANKPAGKAPKRKPNLKAIQSPESAKIDYLNLELNAAKTRIVQLDTTIADYEATIKIQKEKIKLLEQNQLNTANSMFINTWLSQDWGQP